jgi:alanine racemase
LRRAGFAGLEKLLKGRPFTPGKLMDALNPRFDIDLAALCDNYRRLKQSAPGAEAAAVVKCDAYGLGAERVAAVLRQKEGCRTFFVAYSEEGAALRRALGAGPEIFVFNGPFPDSLPAYRDAALTPVLNTPEQAALWAEAAPGAPTALHVDTGMNRLGLSSDEAASLAAHSGLNATMVISHLACAAAPDHPMNDRQRAAFAEIAGRFPHARKSLSSSGGALIGAPFAFDLVRLGVGLYGVNPHDDRPSEMKPVARLTAAIIQLRRAAAGETVGYGATFTTRRPTVLATVALGYGDGLPRAASNRGSAALGGVPCPIVGRVSMDLTVLDVSDAPAPPQIGDRAEFFGERISIDAAAKACGTIGYELLTHVGGLARPRPGLGGRVRRRYLWAGAPLAEGGDEGKK